MFRPALSVHEAGESVVMPGLVDTHVHINEPGRTEWEGFSTATRAAAAGGVTTLIEMPLNSIPATTTAAAYREKIAAAAGKLWVDVGFWGGVVPGNTARAPALVGSGRVRVQMFSCAERRRRICVRDANTIFARRCRNSLRSAHRLLAHAELPGPIEKLR